MKSNPFIMKSPLILIIVFVGIIIGGVYWLFDIKEKRERSRPDDVEIVNTWKLPNKLMEISGIAFLEENRIACIQDEQGIIFIYNISSSEIEREISFGKTGDYEAITVVGNNAYVLRSDGTLFEIMDFMKSSDDPKVNIYDTPMTKDHDLEGLCYDKANNRLLLAMKESDHENNDFKGVYEFDLATKKLATSPIIKLNANLKISDKRKNFLPTEIGIDPFSGKMYILDATNPSLVEFKNENPIEIYELNDRIFPQPEGLTFGSKGEIFIATEGVPGKILQVTLNKK